MPRKQRQLTLLLLFINVITFAQHRSSDVGISIGGSNSWGDYKQQKFASSLNYSVGAFYRYNLNSRYSIKANGLYTQAKGTGTFESVPLSYKKNVIDLALMFEMNFLEYIFGVENRRITPYMVVGIGMMSAFGESAALIYPIDDENPETVGTVVSMNVPFGAGGKFWVTKKLELGAEYTLRKTFTDKLDNLIPQQSGSIDASMIHNNDWMSYLTLSLVYKINVGKLPCPAYN